MTNIYLIRHGFTPANNASYNGQTGLRSIADNENMPLEINYGIKQAQELGVFLNNISGKTKIFVSPYKRCQETLNYALDNMDKKYEIETRNDIYEIDAGVFYARTIDEVLKDYPEYSKNIEELKKDKYGTKYGNGESQYDVRDRVKDFSMMIKDLSNENIYDNIFIIAHGVVNRWINFWLTDDILEHQQKNCEVLFIKDNRYKLVFTPKTFVPKGYIVDIKKHKNL